MTASSRTDVLFRAGEMVGAAGFEPTTTSPPDGRSPAQASGGRCPGADGSPSADRRDSRCRARMDARWYARGRGT
jgi:hypothetical protein